MKKQFFLLIALTLYAFGGGATHLLGGEISYQYISSSKGKITYQVSVSIYSDCLSGNVGLDPSIKIGIYYDNTMKNKLLSETFTLSRKSRLILPCYTSLNMCIELGIYEKTLVLDSTAKGCYLTYVRCCRSEIKNVKNTAPYSEDKGLTLLSYLSPTKFRNSSPGLSNHPLVYHAVDKSSVDYCGVFDRDGDSLVYKIVAPYKGAILSNSSPDPTSIMDSLLPVHYLDGFSAEDPLGDSGTTSLDSTNGILTLTCTMTEFYAFCIEIKEFRDGQLIGLHRRDYPLMFINFPSGSNPVKISLEKPSLFKGNKVSLYWDICPQSVRGFNIERREKSSAWSVIKKVEKTNFGSDSIDYDKWYYYRIQSMVDSANVISNVDSVFAKSAQLRSSDYTKHRIRLYPNPASHELVLEHSFTPHYHIFDINGRLLKTYHEVTNPVSSIDIQDLEPGLYYIYLETEVGWMREKFVKLGT